jgi:Icc-related predicted phosphoesterase
MKPSGDIVRLAAIADIHYTRTSRGALQPLFAAISECADIFLLCGDATDNGQPEEARVLAQDLTAAMRIPTVGVLGNHDHESGKQEELKEIFFDAGIRILDGSTCEIRGIGFAGVKGFAGGFDHGALQPWGEDAIKHFVRESVEEALRLESALAKLHAPRRIALLHYAPVRATVTGENAEIFPFLGSSRLEEALNRAGAAAAFHGHAHSGSPEGRTKDGIPVYNVSKPLLQRAFPERLPFRLVEFRTERKDSHD